MRVLLVEEQVPAAVQLSELLRVGGHVVAVGRNGDDALAQCARFHPDLVIISEPLADGDGMALSQAVQDAAAPRWLPVILLTAERDAARRLQALEAGCAACLIKPVEPALLDERIERIERRCSMQQESEARLERLSCYLAEEEDDLQLASHLVERQMMAVAADRFEDPAVQHWRRPCRRLAGDMLTVARGPDGVLHAMLADARGRGLSAYVSLLPVIMPFRRMTEKGFPLGAIARELNRKVRQMLPAGRAVAALLAAVNPREGIVSVWNGGMPTPFTLDAPGHHFHEFPLRHAPLGELDDQDFDACTEQRAFALAEQLIMFSDGLLEAADAVERRFGEQGLADALVGAPAERRLHAVVSALEAHLKDARPADDMTLALINCDRQPGGYGKLPPDGGSLHRSGRWRFELRLGPEELARADVVPLLLNVVGQFAGEPVPDSELFVVLSELYNNALDHGVLRLDSRLKASPEGMETWLMLREERLAVLRSGEIVLSVEQMGHDARCVLRVRCRDSGPGFDIEAVLARLERPDSVALAEVMPFGRGLLLVKRLAERIEPGPAPNEVTVILAGNAGSGALPGKDPAGYD